MVRLRLSWVDGHPIVLNWIDGAPMILSHTDRSPVIPTVELSQVLDALDVFFVSCAMCLELSGVIAYSRVQEAYKD